MRIEGEVVKAVPRIKPAHGLIERMRQDPPTRNIPGSPERSAQREQQKRACVTFSVATLVDCQLAEKRRRQGIWFVSLSRFRKAGSLDLRRAQRHIADNTSSRYVANDIDARNADGMIGPAVASEPMIHRIAATVETAAIVRFRERSRRRYFRHLSGLRESFSSAAIFWGGRCAQASKALQSLAGMTTRRRSRKSISAASSALRRMKSLILVRACSDAASKRARSASFTRTLNTELAMIRLPLD